MGLLGMMVAERYGGAGLDPLTYCLAVEEVARICPSTAVTMSVTNSVCCWPIARFGSEELKQRSLPELAVGGGIGGFGLTEPGSGSDAGSDAHHRPARRRLLGARRREGVDHQRRRRALVRGRGQDRPGGRQARASRPSWSPPTRRASRSACRRRSSACAPRAPRRWSSTGCRIPAGHLLGAPRATAFKIALATLDHSRLGIAAQAVGIHQRALELAVAYARDRVQFGRPIAEHQAIRFKIAEMATELAAARALTHAAAAAAGADDPRAGRLASEAKLYASEAANRAATTSLQIHGGNGFHDDYEIARLYRDVRVTTIYEGTSEMQRTVIARAALRG